MCVWERKTLFLLVWRKWQHHLPQSLTFQVKAFLFLFVSLSSAKKQKKPFTHPMQFREDLPYQHLVYKQRVNFTNNLHAAFVLISFGPKFQTQTVCTYKLLKTLSYEKLIVKCWRNWLKDFQWNTFVMICFYFLPRLTIAM